MIPVLGGFCGGDMTAPSDMDGAEFIVRCDDDLEYVDSCRPLSPSEPSIDDIDILLLGLFGPGSIVLGSF